MRRSHCSPSASNTLPRPRTNPRSGVSLVELLIVMTALGVVLTTSTVTLYRMLQAQSAATTGLSEAMTLSRLAADFRRDVHAASGVAVENVGDTTELRLSDVAGNSVVYAAREGRLIRESMPEEAPPADAQPTREEYRLGPVVITFELRESERLAAVLLTRRDSAESVPTSATGAILHRQPTDTTIVAAVGIAHEDEASREAAP
ncbi:MAG: prepilin-type N-terminal cleavage/methylation domain-containing protein [Planctomycetaceae bacterium]|nr:prepilin-type N-terminal cleavage/methylation domain-containing protein [Planctomycetaceae bacterium]